VVQDDTHAGLYVTYYATTGGLWQALLRGYAEWHELALQLTLARYAALGAAGGASRMLTQETANGAGLPLAPGDAAQVGE
jgi:hypothetical protein